MAAPRVSSSKIWRRFSAAPIMKSFLNTSFRTLCCAATGTHTQRSTNINPQRGTNKYPSVPFCGFLVPFCGLLRNFEFDRLILYRTRTDHDVEPSRLDHTLHIQIEKRQLVGRDHKLNVLAFARRERDALEVFQLHDRPRHRAHQVVNVELHDLVARSLAAVGDGDADLRFARHANLRRINFQVRIRERRVAEPEPERKQRLLVREEIPATRSWLAVVVKRKLAHRTRKTDRQFARRIVITEQNVGDSGARLLPQIKALENRRHILGDVVDREWTTVDQQ